MNYTKGIKITDRAGYEREGIGVTCFNDTVVVGAVARKHPNPIWRENHNNAGMNSTIGFIDVEVFSFISKGKPDKKGYIEGEVGGKIISPTSSYVVRTKDAKGELGEPFVKSILNYSYTPNGTTKSYGLSSLFGAELTEAIQEALNMAPEHMSEGVSQRTYARLAKKFSDVTNISKNKESKEGEQSASHENSLDEALK